MRVALDATPLTLSSGGLRRYVEELARALAASFPEDQYWLVSDQPFRPLSAPGNLRCGRPPSGGIARRWWLAGLPRELEQVGADLFHGTNFEVPWRGRTPAVLTVHDLSPWLEVRWQPSASRVRRRTPWLIRMGRAELILTHTEAVRRQVLDRFRLPPSRVIAVPLAAAALFRPVEVPPVRRPYFLFAGTLEPRKNLPMLIEAFREVRRRHDVDLVLAGRKREDCPRLPPCEGLRWVGEVTDEELRTLYCGALACVYPSLYEGFGLPALEAMQCGAAVIASRDPAIAEVTGDAAWLLDPTDARAWAEAMLALLERPDRRSARRERAMRRAAGFNWETT
ncbi:MAG: glycosyltransferase family 1 protein, partial [Bryobacterales bacterium]|nr:glycosyltransferase family 1 protein [Bryobacterales bacterium]